MDIMKIFQNTYKMLRKYFESNMSRFESHYRLEIFLKKSELFSIKILG